MQAVYVEQSRWGGHAHTQVDTCCSSIALQCNKTGQPCSVQQVTQAIRHKKDSELALPRMSTVKPTQKGHSSPIYTSCTHPSVRCVMPAGTSAASACPKRMAWM
jgi:hypothetical protein